MTREEWLKKHHLTEEQVKENAELKKEAYKKGFAIMTDVDLALMGDD